VFSGKRYTDNANTVILSAYQRIDAMLGYRFSRFDLRLAMTNLGDTKWYRSATSAGQILPGAPRTLTASIRFDF